MESDSSAYLNVQVAQLGARRHYAVPVALHRRGMLAHFFTDIYLKSRSSAALIRAAANLIPVPGIQRLAGRHHPGLPPDMVTSFWRLGWAYKRRMREAQDPVAAWLWAGGQFCREVLKHSLGNSDSIYAYSSAAKELLEYCREHDMRGILDHATAPRLAEMKWVAEECERFPGWSRHVPDLENQALYAQRQGEEANLADVIICGSSFVKRMLVDDQVPSEKIAVVPLGLDVQSYAFTADSGRNVGLNVLFVGGEAVRKGIGYLAEATKQVSSKSIRVRAVGNLGLTDTGLKSIREHIELVGPVPRSQLHPYFSWADVLVLPSVSETFGLVILEALAAGIPVITTHNTCGPDVIREGQDGFVVPIRDAPAIAEKLDLLAADQSRLNEMKRSACNRAGEFSLEKYSRHLERAIRHI